MSIVRRQDENDEWKNIKYLIFDGPELKGNFKTRLKLLKEILDKCDNKYVKLHEHKVCKGQQHLDEEMKRITDLKGEGVML